MRHLTFSETVQAAYPVCLLVPAIRKDEIRQAYIDPHQLDPNDLLVIDLHYKEGVKKTPMAEMKRYISEELVPVWTDMKVEYLLVADGEYFKALTKAAKVDPNLGYVLDCTFGPWKVVYVPNFRAIFYDPDKVKGKIAQGIEALKAHRAGSYQDPGIDIIHFAAYPRTYDEIEAWMKRIFELPALSCDIEAFSLKHPTAGIGTITFCWSQHEGIAFPVDLGPDSARVRELLRDFFIHYQGKLIWHQINYDVYVLIFQLFMKHILDQKGLLYGLEVMLRNWDDTKLITYLATNSCAGNQLSLKVQSQEFSGKYALLDEDPDIRRYPLEDVLQYNLIDGLSTWYVHNKRWHQMVADDQLDIYRQLFQPAMIDIIQMQLTGLPLNMGRVKEVKALLQADMDKALATIASLPLVQRYTHRMNEKWVEKRNQELKIKRVSLADANEVFNPNSNPQLQDLLYGMLGLPVIAFTDNKQPATGKDTLEALVNHTSQKDVITFLKAMVDYGNVNKILSDFIPSMEAATLGPDGWHYLFGNFNLGGTISGRLSSSNPNLQNLPANSFYAKLIKSCFQAPPGWLFCGYDFASLEDKISAVTTKDPNKLKVYTDGYDGHCLRAYAYFTDQMPDIDPNSVTSINSIQKLYKPLRQDSKVPTFLLTYQGTWKGIVEQCGIIAEKARKIEASYHELYKVSDAWVAKKLDEASRVGYVTVAFGLRLRTPLLHQVIRDTRKTPFEATAEGRSAGNALGQSWCLLNSRCGSAFMGQVRKSTHRLDIKPCAQIHDAGYFMVRDDIGALKYTNDTLIPETEWQDHPDIQHDDVKLGGELSVFFPSWQEEIHIPKGANEHEIFQAIDKALEAA